MGIPVLATNVGGTNEIVKNEYNGFLLNKETNGSDIASNIELFAALWYFICDIHGGLSFVLCDKVG